MSLGGIALLLKRLPPGLFVSKWPIESAFSASENAHSRCQCDGKVNFNEIFQFLKCPVNSHMPRILGPSRTGQRMTSEAFSGNLGSEGSGGLIRTAATGNLRWGGGGGPPNKTARDKTSTVTACGLCQINELLNFPVPVPVV